MPTLMCRLQDMPPPAAHFCLKVERFCRDELGVDLSGTKVLVAYSGGADSLALLLALHALSRRLGVEVAAATLDHGLREESAGEARAAGAFCAELGIAFFTDRRDTARFAAEQKLGLEEAGRNIRADFLESVRRANDCDWIALGHQLNDLAEDSLMRMLRGAGWPGLAGMEGVDAARHMVRPLLLTARSDIETFVSDLGLSWTMDAMNADMAYLRNRVRHELLPLCLRENPSFLDAVASRWRLAREDAAYFKEITRITPAAREGEVFLPRPELAAAPAAVRLRQYKHVLDSLGNGQALLAPLFTLDALWRKNQGGGEVSFPGGKKAVIRNGGIVFTGKQ